MKTREEETTEALQSLGLDPKDVEVTHHPNRVEVTCVTHVGAVDTEALVRFLDVRLSVESGRLQIGWDSSISTDFDPRARNGETRTVIEILGAEYVRQHHYAHTVHIEFDSDVEFPPLQKLAEFLAPKTFRICGGYDRKVRVKWETDTKWEPKS